MLVTLSHPYVARILDTGEIEGWPFLVLPFLAGGSLADRLQGMFPSVGQSLAPIPLSDWLPQIADALDFIHRRGYVHRDVKPANILFDDRDHAFLADFGVAKAFAGSAAAQTAKLTAVGLVVGTPEYLAPECVMGGEVDGRADQYALAVTVYEILSGHVPFANETPAAVLVQQCTQAPEPLSNRNRTIAASVSDMVMRALSKNPSERFASCTEFAEAVVQGLTLPSAAPVPAKSAPPAIKAPPRGTQEATAVDTAATSIDGPRVKCPKCGCLLRLRPQMMSSVARCPKCSHAFDVTPLLAATAAQAPTPADVNVKISQPVSVIHQGTRSSRSKLTATIVAAVVVPVLLIYMTIQFMSEPNPVPKAPMTPEANPRSEATKGESTAPPIQIIEDPDYLLALKLHEGRGERIDQARSRELFRRAADRGHLLAMAYVANDLWNGCLGGQIDKDEGLRLYQKILPELKQMSDRGDAMAQDQYGFVLYDGIGVPKDETQGVSWFLLAADKGLAIAQIDLGYATANGRGLPKDDSAALAWYRKAADQNVAGAQNRLGVMYAEGRGVTKDDVEAVNWYRKAAEQNDPQGQVNLGIMSAAGRGVTKDEAEAVSWYRKAANQNYANAQFSLGLMYADGRGVAKDEAEAVRWYLKAADQNSAYAQDSLGDCYANGRGVSMDDAEAIRWYRKAAEQNLVYSQNSLGGMYANGRGVTKDDTEAVRWYRKAADQNYANSQYWLGSMYAEGRGVTKDEKEAIRWFHKAAEQNDVSSQNRLGTMYAEGCGTVKDDKEAVRWYRKAAEQDFAYAQNSLGDC